MGLLRILLAISVVLEHIDPHLLPKLYPGNIAVEIFFMISGFYMTLILSEKYDGASVTGILGFYQSRFFRLWPIFIVVTVLVNLLWLFAYFYLGHSPTEAAPLREWIGNDVVYFLAKASNVLMVGQDVTSLAHVWPTGARFTFGPPDLADGSISMGYLRDIGPAWSIGLEIWFYLLAPFLVRLSIGWLGALVTISLALRAGMTAFGLCLLLLSKPTCSIPSRSNIL